VSESVEQTDQEEIAAIVARLSETVVFPRFLGVDDSGDFVWELENGRWTWGETPDEVVERARTFEPERYVVKYGSPHPMRDRKTEY